MTAQLDVVTGAFSYSGAAISRELTGRGHQVRTLTGHPDRAPAGTAIAVRPLDFSDPAGLRESLAGAHTLYNTYWVRFAHGAISHDAAVPEGEEFVIRCRLASIEKRRLNFDIEVNGAGGPVSRGTHQRAVVSLERMAG